MELNTTENGVDLADQMRRLIELGISLSSEEDIDVLLEKILFEAKDITNADGGTLYLVDELDRLTYAIMYNSSLHMHNGGKKGEKITIPPIPLKLDNGVPNLKNVASFTAFSGEVTNLENVYDSSEFDFEGMKKFDAQYSYKSKSFLTVPLKNHNKDVIAVLQLINAQNETGEIISFSYNVQKIVEALASQASIALNNRKLLEDHRRMMEAFIEVLAKAIDAKSPYTGAHCQRVPVLTRMITMEASLTEEGPFEYFDLNDNDWYALHVASWLHDCGKIITPEYINDKATKLETIHNRIHEIRTRYEVLRRDAHINYLKKRLAGTDDQTKLLAELNRAIKNLEAEFAIIAKANVGDERLSEEDIDLLDRIGKRTFTRNFDRTLGLSWEEKSRLDNIEELQKMGKEYVLENRNEHIFGGFNRGELYNLSIPAGTLTEEEHKKVKEHVNYTIEMLGNLHLPKSLANVPEYAGLHHERMDGSGYPYGVKGVEMSIPAKIMMMADIFEAITASDRPYKKPKKLSEALDILYKMTMEGLVDEDIFYLFIEKEIYQQYADHYLKPEQIDKVIKDKYMLAKNIDKALKS